jgi:hypothetical protein
MRTAHCKATRDGTKCRISVNGEDSGSVDPENLDIVGHTGKVHLVWQLKQPDAYFWREESEHGVKFKAPLTELSEDYLANDDDDDTPASPDTKKVKRYHWTVDAGKLTCRGYAIKFKMADRTITIDPTIANSGTTPLGVNPVGNTAQPTKAHVNCPK